MKDLLPTLLDWTAKDRPFAIATVIKTWGSSPRPIGSSLIVSSEMEMAGSVSGGCVEGAVLKAAQPIIKNGGSRQLGFGVSNDEAWAVGLTCGGKVSVFVERFFAFDKRPTEQAAWQKLKHCLSANEACVLLTNLEEGQGAHTVILPNGETYGEPISEHLKTEALRTYRERKNQVLEIPQSPVPNPQSQIPNPQSPVLPYFAQVFPRRSQMLIIGAAHITAHLVTLAAMYDFETTVIDPRRVFADKTQFATPPDHLVSKYPSEVLSDYILDAYTYAVILSHDPKIDDNALHVLLKSDVGYIGALGSRRTHEKRVKRLEEAGFSETEIGKIHAPIGMDIRAKTPGEIALSVMGEIIGVKNAF